VQTAAFVKRIFEIFAILCILFKKRENFSVLFCGGKTKGKCGKFEKRRGILQKHLTNARRSCLMKAERGAERPRKEML
jgi:hypothetical protein